LNIDARPENSWLFSVVCATMAWSFLLCMAMAALSLVTTGTDALTTTTTAAAVTVCPRQGSLARGAHYHDDSQCNRAAYNQFKASLGRHLAYQSFKAVGGVRTVPNQKTVTCPLGGARVNLKDENAPDDGLDTIWFVENRASTPVVVAYVTPDGHEVSAKNPKIVPAVADPSAILAPGAWMAVYTFEGHEFVVREVKTVGGGATTTVAGNVLLQHRAGLIPIGATSQSLDCPDADVAPMQDNAIAPGYRRTPAAVNRRCHTMDIGFRNMANCPLHGYYVDSDDSGTSCTEEFKLHLGVDSVTHDFFNDWTSNTKFEGTFIGHTFHFRLASNPTVLVETVTLAPVIVTDCPTTSVAAQVSVGSLGSAVWMSDAQFSNSSDSAASLSYQMPYSSSSSYSNNTIKNGATSYAASSKTTGASWM
jgi:hypothetical protein